MTESPVETLEKAIVLHLFWTEGLTSFWHSYIGIPINFHEESGIVTFRSKELSAPLDVSKGCEALCPEELEDYGFL